MCAAMDVFQARVRCSRGKQAIGVRAAEVQLCHGIVNIPLVNVD